MHGTMVVKEKDDATDDAPNFGTMVFTDSNPTAKATTTNSYFKTEKWMMPPTETSLLKLRMALINLNKAYDDEKQQLEVFYNNRRQQLQALVQEKEQAKRN